MGLSALTREPKEDTGTRGGAGQRDVSEGSQRGQLNPELAGGNSTNKNLRVAAGSMPRTRLPEQIASVTVPGGEAKPRGYAGCTGMSEGL